MFHEVVVPLRKLICVARLQAQSWYGLGFAAPQHRAAKSLIRFPLPARGALASITLSQS